MHTPNAGNQLATLALNKSNLIIVTGIQWGDEGKGKAVSTFQGKDIRYVAGPNGGGNAGHTVYYKGQKLDFHELPGGSVIEGARVYLAKGKVIQLSTLGKEMEKLKGAGINLTEKIVIGGGAQIILESFQQKLDAEIERLLGCNAVGTTKKGIGPAYAAQALRVGFTIGELLTMNNDQIRKRVDVICGLFGGLEKQPILDELAKERTKLLDWVYQGIVTIDYDDMLIHDAVNAGNNVLVEQSQSFLLGKEGGSYPYCTSSDTSVHGMMSYMNLPYTVRPVVIGTAKAIMSKVGGGYLATKMGHEPDYTQFEKDFAKSTGEMGVTTGRLRDLGWVDMPALRHVTRINPLAILLITKGDVLTTLAKAQESAGLKKEMRFYTGFENPETGLQRASGVTHDSKMVGTYESIPLSTTSTEDNIRLYGERICKYLPKFATRPLFFGTGPEEHEITRYER